VSAVIFKLIKPLTMNNCQKILVACCFTSCVSWVSCTKQNEWLDSKANKRDIIPTKLADFQAVLDHDEVYLNNAYPFLGQLSCDDYYSTYANWQAAAVLQRNAYTWDPDTFGGGVSGDWNNPYNQVAYANICLEGLETIQRDDENKSVWDNVKGSALFYRSQAYYHLLQQFAKPYDAATASSDPGVVLRNTANVNQLFPRSSNEACYRQMITDLEEAETLLAATPAFGTRPSKLATAALLSRIYLSMREYPKAGLYADKLLQQYSTLVDYNTLNGAASFPFPTYQAGNKEIFFYATASSSTLQNLNGIIDSTLYKSYAANDLRRTLLFKTTNGVVTYRGSYAGQLTGFGGMAVNEFYLNRAEVHARQGNLTAAMTDLNALLVKRWKTGTFVPVTATTQADALAKILTERRKELLFTGIIRWVDLRRLNKEPAFAKTLTRNLNGVIYTLLPDDPRYVFPIPDNEIRLSGIAQNPR
jgi:hypothetical protein